LAVLEVSRLTASYGRARVLFGIDLELRAGEVAVLLGPNGAGKTTTLKSIMGLLRPDSGEVRFEGLRIDAREPFEIARLGLGYVPEDRRVFTALTVAENLEVGRKAPPPGVRPWTAEKLYGLFPALEAMRARLAANMSGGEQQMLAIARTLMGNPKALLLDEPAEGLAPKIVEDIANAILALKREGLAVLLSEQNLAFARRLGDRAYLLEQGQVRRTGALAEFEDNLPL
jgi:branched-chain amino acid transport system ATP-binding protein